MEDAKSSGFQIVDSVVCDRPCLISGVQAYMDGTNASTLIVYDNATEASGKILFKASLTAAGQNYATKDWTFPIPCVNGIFADITGTNAGYIVEYME